MERRTLLLGSAYSSMLGLAGCGGSDEDRQTSEAPDLQPPSVGGSKSATAEQDRKFALAWTNEVEAIVNYSHKPSWVYYTDRLGSRWYISPFELYSRASGIYSLGPLVNGQASWWTVATSAVTGNSAINSLTVGAIADDLRSDTFYDIGRRINVTDSLIHSDRSKIANSSVPAKWYFFSAPNGRWYIIADPGYGSINPPIIRRFDALNGNYNWVEVDTTGVRAIFQWFLGELTIRFSPIPRYVSSNQGQSRDMDGSYGAQCVDLMHHYIDSALGIAYPHGFTGNAYAIYSAAASSTTKTSSKFGSVVFTKIANSATAVPLPGDIVFWSAPDPGHVAVVIDANISGFSSLDQNWVNSSTTVGSPAAVVQHNYTNVAGWFRPTW
jgi:hypothetical protein